MRWIIIAVASLFLGGIWDQPVFTPVTHADGSQTWTLSMSIKDFPKEDRALSAKELGKKYAGGVLGHYRFCEAGWTITSSRIEKSRLLLEGACQSRSS